MEARNKNKIRRSLMYARFKNLVTKHQYNIAQLRAMVVLMNEISAFNYDWYSKYANNVVDLLEEEQSAVKS